MRYIFMFEVKKVLARMFNKQASRSKVGERSDSFAGCVEVDENKDNFSSHIMFRKLQLAT